MVYEPQEDSFLLQEFVLKVAKGNVLDMGTGSGIQAATAARSRKVNEVYGADIDPEAIEFAKKHQDSKLNIKWVKSDLFEKFKRKKFHHYFDVIVFNAPYLPHEGGKRHIDLEGGPVGHETIERFLQDAQKYLKPDGKILLAFSSLTPHMPDMLYKYWYAGKELGKRHLFFEDILVYELKKNPDLVALEKKGVTGIAYFTKGKRGYIFTGRYKNKKVAIKVKHPRSTAVRTIPHEAKMLKLVNKHGLGPKYVLHSPKYLVYEFVEGKLLQDLLESPRIRWVCKEVFRQCFKLDQLKLDKKEMLRPRKHVIVKGKNVTMIDWERAHRVKDPHNVTQFCQFVRNNVEKKDKQRWIDVAREYRKKPSRAVLNKILKMV